MAEDAGNRGHKVVFVGITRKLSQFATLFAGVFFGFFTVRVHDSMHFLVKADKNLTAAKAPEL